MSVCVCVYVYVCIVCVSFFFKTKKSDQRTCAHTETDLCSEMILLRDLFKAILVLWAKIWIDVEIRPRFDSE